MREKLHGARDGRGATLIVEGMAGLGKTRLLEEAMAIAREFVRPTPEPRLENDDPPPRTTLPGQTATLRQLPSDPAIGVFGTYTPTITRDELNEALDALDDALRVADEFAA